MKCYIFIRKNCISYTVYFNEYNVFSSQLISCFVKMLSVNVEN